MEFRWIAIITLWTILVGPIFDQPAKAPHRAPHAAAAVKTIPLSPPAHALPR